MTRVVQSDESNQIDELIEQFGPTLDGDMFHSGLTQGEKINLRAVLSLWLSVRQISPDLPIVSLWLRVEDVWPKIIDNGYAMCSEDVQKAITILHGITKEQANELIRALSEQIILSK